MSRGGKKYMGPGAQGKSSGTGALTDLDPEKIEENMVLSNRDKSQHTGGRGLDSKHVQTDQLRDHVGNRVTDE